MPREISALVRFAQQNDFASATKLHRKLYPLFKALFIEPNPVPLKAALARAGIIASEAVRLPLSPMEPATRAVLVKALAGLGK
jgi:4-hydroxy-tetrahydrodipicolinate synthase